MKKKVVYIFISLFVIVGVILVSSAGLDINNDGIVNITDLQLLATHFQGKGTYNSSYDFNNNGKVDLFDLVKVARGINISSGGSGNVTPMFSDGFESYTSGANLNGEGYGGFVWNGDGYGSQPVVDTYAYSGNKSLEFSYPSSPEGGDSWRQEGFSLAQNAISAPKEVWIDYWERIPSNFVHRDESAVFINTTGSITAGSTRLTLNQPLLDGTLVNGVPAAQLWEIKSMTGAGASGGDLTYDPIFTYINSTTANLETPANTTVTNARVLIKNQPNYGTSNDKFFFLWANTYSNVGTDVQVGLEYEPSGSYMNAPKMLGLGYEYPGTLIRDSSTGMYQAPYLFNSTDYGKWIHIQMYARVGNSTDTGIWEGWVNGVLKWRSGNFSIYYPGGNNYFLNGYIMGWANSGFSNETNFYIDNFKIYDQNPGWI